MWDWRALGSNPGHGAGGANVDFSIFRFIAFLPPAEFFFCLGEMHAQVAICAPMCPP